MKTRASLLACAGLALTVAFAPLRGRAAEPVPAPSRFSQSLTTADRTASGLARLSSDQIAVLDALVRRDTAAQAAPPRADAPALPARFSQRLTADEHRNAGLTLLTESELALVDTRIERTATAILARTLLSPPAYVPLSVRARVAEAKPTVPAIHGSFTLGMSFGKGYSERFGGITLNYEDPARNLAISFSYSESHLKGNAPYYIRDPLYAADRLPRFTTEP